MNFVKEKTYNALVDEYNKINEARISDNHFYTIALRMTGDPEKYMSMAEKLINEHGILKALQLSRQ